MLKPCKEKSRTPKLQVGAAVLVISLFWNEHKIKLKFGLSGKLYFCTVNSTDLGIYKVCRFFYICVSLIFFFFVIYFEKSLSYILSSGGFVESSFSSLDLAGLDHHCTTIGGAREPGTDIPVAGDCQACS